jgi:hypothetical protein
MTSPLSRDELASTLREQIDSPFVLFGKKTFIGRASASRIWIVRRVGYRNSFQTVLTATLSTSDSGGTLLRCRTGMSAFVIAFLSVWFGGVLTIGGAVVSLPFIEAAWKPELLILPAMLLFGVGLVSFGRWLAKGEDELLVSFLEDAVDARR